MSPPSKHRSRAKTWRIEMRSRERRLAVRGALLSVVSALWVYTPACGHVVIGENPGVGGDGPLESSVGGSAGFSGLGSTGGAATAAVGGSPGAGGLSVGKILEAQSEFPLCEKRLELGPEVLPISDDYSADIPSVDLTDVNGDGKMDVVAVYPGRFWVLIQMDGGQWDGPIVSEGQHLRVYGAPLFDINQDGLGDIIVLTAKDSEPNPDPPYAMEVYLGNGAGQFAFVRRAATDGLTQPEFEGRPFTDLDGDGRDDVVYVQVGEELAILPSRVGQVSQARNLSPIRPGDPLAAADFNGDDLVDFALASASFIQILLAEPQGGFASAAQIAPGFVPEMVETGDFNEDGHFDIVVQEGCAGAGVGAVRLLFGMGDGSFGGGVEMAARTCGAFPSVADLDRDGHLDFLSEPQPVFGVGEGSFVERAPLGTWFSASSLPGLYEVTGDGILDAISRSPRWAVLPGRGDGAFENGLVSNVEIGGSLQLADATGDGLLDVVSVTGTKLVIAQGNGDGTFVLLSEYPTSVTSVEVVDINGDGLQDVVGVSSPAGDVITILLNDGKGSYSQTLLSAGDAHAEGVGVGDLDGDGKVDLVAGDSLFFGDGDGGFERLRHEAMVGEPLIGDVDSDDRDEIVVALSGEQFAYVFDVSAGRELTRGAIAGEHVPVALTELDGDGVIDIVTRVTGSTGVFVNRGLGAGNFAGERHVYGQDRRSWPAGSLGAADVDGDGNRDLVFSDTVLRGAGGGRFTCLNVQALGQGRLGDVNGDGRVDFVSSDIVMDDVASRSSRSIIRTHLNGMK